jgi:hypothetical protein
MLTKRMMMVAAAAAVTMVTAGAAWAQRGPVAYSCDREIGRYCANVPHGGGEVRACLQRHRGKLSRQCRNALDGTGGGRRWR